MAIGYQVNAGPGISGIESPELVEVLNGKAVGSESYVALGDSYSAGEGNPPFNPADLGCDQSESVAWPELLAKKKSLDLTDLLACSGASTSALSASFNGQPPQLDALQTLSPQLVTITIGGNDLNFDDILTNCTDAMLHTCGPNSDDLWIAHLPVNIESLEPTLVATFEGLRQAAPNATIYVIGYPDVFPPNPTANDLNQCSLATLVPIGQIPESGISYLASNEEPLTMVESEAATQAGVPFIDPNARGPHSFQGHSVCAGKSSWFNKPNPANVDYSYHPNKAGQKALAAIVGTVVR